MKPINIARKMMRVRGYCVVGFRNKTHFRSKGDILRFWGNGDLGDNHWIRLTKKTTLKDWREQFVAIFGTKKAYPWTAEHHKDASFMRAVLEKVPRANP